MKEKTPNRVPHRGFFFKEGTGEKGTESGTKTPAKGENG